MYLFIFKNQKNLKILIYSISVLTATSVLIFLSGERAAFILMILLKLYFIFMIKELKLFRTIFFFISIVSIVGIFFLNENVQSRYLQTIKEVKKSNSKVNNEILDSEYTIGNYYIISPTHNNYYITAYRMFLDNKSLDKALNHLDICVMMIDLKLTSGAVLLIHITIIFSYWLRLV